MSCRIEWGYGHVLPARIDFCLDDDPGEPLAYGTLPGEDAVDFVPVFVQSALA